MKKLCAVLLIVVGFGSLVSRADIVVLRDGKSYSGSYSASRTSTINFRDAQGIRYSFPVADVQTIVFSNVSDHLSLRNGHSYAGTWVGVTTLAFQGANGVGYVFPLRDVSTLILSSPEPKQNSASGAAQASGAGSYNTATPLATNATVQTGLPAPSSTYSQTQPEQSQPQLQQHNVRASGMNSETTSNIALIIPSGSQIVVRTDVAIDSTANNGRQFYPAQIQQDVMDGNGDVAIPAGTSAQLQILNTATSNTGGSHQNNPLMLDLYSVTVNGKQYRVDTSSVTDSAKTGIGMNLKTGEYAGGGGALGALLGAAFGGGEGAGIGALVGAGGGVLTQALTHGKQVKIPAETTLTFQLVQTLVLHQ